LVRTEDAIFAKWSVALPLAVTAGLVAEAARSQCPSADEMPFHGAAPVWIVTPSEWRLCVCSDRTRGLAVASNARIEAPVWSPREPGQTGSAPLVAGALVRDPAFETKTTHGCALFVVTLRTAAPGTEVEFAGQGSIAREGRDAIAATLLFASTLCVARAAQEAGQLASARSTLQAALTPAADPGARAPGTLRAALHLELAALALSCSDLPQARLQIDHALANLRPEPRLLVALAALDRRMAHTTQTRTGLLRLACLAGSPLLAARGQAELMAQAKVAAPALAAATSRDAAREWLAAGDQEAAVRWLARAECEEVTKDAEDLAPALLGSSLTPRELYERRLVAIARLGRSHERLLALSASCVSRGDRLLAVHVLAHETGPAAEALRATLLQTGVGLETSLVDRVLATARVGEVFGRIQGALASPPR